MAWLADYTYRKEIDISRASGAVTNYQMKLLVGESSGATGENVDCAGHCLSNFNDLRFTAADGTTLLDYWIESITGTTPNQLATVWIEFDSIGTGATNFYMYYGNAGAAAASSGANTFLFFDDFPGSTLDTTTNWSVYQGDITVTGSHLVLTGTAGTRGIINTKSEYPKPLRIRTKAQFSNATTNSFHFLSIQNSVQTHYSLTYTTNSSTQIRYANAAGGTEETASYDVDATTSDLVYEKTWDTNVVKVYQAEVLKSTQTTYIPTANLAIYEIEGITVGETCSIDWVFIADFRTTEPAWGSWGAEEVGTQNLTWSGDDTVRLTESNINIRARFSAVADTINISESTSAIKIFLISVLDTIRISETIGFAKGLIISVSDTINLTENISNIRARLTSVIDTINLTEVTTNLKSIIVSIFDTIRITENTAVDKMRLRKGMIKMDSKQQSYPNTLNRTENNKMKSNQQSYPVPMDEDVK